MRDFRFQIPDFRFFAGVLVLVAALSIAAGAQTQPPASANEFVPLSEAAPREVLPATPLVFYAYGFVWVALLGYVFTIWRRMAQVERDLADVQRRLKDGGGAR